MKCSQCQFYQDMPAAVDGECRRHAPTLLVLNGTCGETSAIESHWPYTSPDDWCGEFRAPQPLTIEIRPPRK